MEFFKVVVQKLSIWSTAALYIVGWAYTMQQVRKFGWHKVVDEENFAFIFLILNAAMAVLFWLFLILWAWS